MLGNLVTWEWIECDKTVSIDQCLLRMFTEFLSSGK